MKIIPTYESSGRCFPSGSGTGGEAFGYGREPVRPGDSKYLSRHSPDGRLFESKHASIWLVGQVGAFSVICPRGRDEQLPRKTPKVAEFSLIKAHLSLRIQPGATGTDGGVKTGQLGLTLSDL
jgi:hypothetical protein